MTLIRSLLLASLLSTVTLPAFAAVPYAIAPSYDGIFYSLYQSGNKPQGGTTCPPATYTGLNLGDGGGTICDNGAGAYLFTVTGTGTIQDGRVVYKDGGSGDVQIDGEINNDFAGSTQVFAAIGLGLRETTSTTSYVAQCKSLQVSSTAVQCQYGIAGSTTNVNCASSGLNRPVRAYVTYDKSSGDIKGFTSTDLGVSKQECFTTNRALSPAVLGYLIGGSKSATISLTGSVDNYHLTPTIDAYTPSDPGGGIPTVSPIPDQSGTQGLAYSLTFSSYFTSATSYSLGSAFPGALTESSDGVLSGTPNATDVSSSPYSRDLCGTNVSGTKCDSVSFTFLPAGGDVFTVPDVGDAAASTFTCTNAATGANGASWASVKTSGSGSGPPGAGDTIIVSAGTRGTMDVVNCQGTLAQPITLKNDPSGSGPVILQWASGGTTFLFRCTSCIGFVLNGLGGWSGQSTAQCGISTSAAFPTIANTPCGIQLQTDADGAPAPQSWVKFKGLSSQYTIKGISIDGHTSTAASDSGIGIDCNDHTVKNATNPGVWREDITITQNNILKNGNKTADGGAGTGEGMYCGPNAADDDLPLRRMVISYNYVEGSPRECVNGKYWREAPNYIHHNYLKNCASQNAAGQARGINVTDGGDVDIYSNVIDNPNGAGISHIINSANSGDPGSQPFYSNIYNNIVWSASGSSVFVKSSVAAEDKISPVHIDYNTLVDSGSPAISWNAVSSTCEAKDNVIAGSSTTISACTNTNNIQGTVGAQFFVNAGSNNYELTSSSPACNTGSGTSLLVDYEDETRPQDIIRDRGADEATACPTP